EHIAKHIGQINASIPKITYMDLSNESEAIDSSPDLMSLDIPVSSVRPSLLSSQDQEVASVQGKEKTNEPRQDIDNDMDSGWDSFARLSPLGDDILKSYTRTSQTWRLDFIYPTSFYEYLYLQLFLML
ncbi:unnamed protein product, partial [Owenia fusiformis]